jgi:hypothetical protein
LTGVDWQFNASANSLVTFGTRVPLHEGERMAPLIRTDCWNKSDEKGGIIKEGIIQV